VQEETLRQPRSKRSLIALVVVAQVALLLAFAPIALGAIETTVSIVAVPNPAWSDDVVTVTATVTPNPGGGFIFMNRGDYQIDPATGSASFQTVFDFAGARPVTATFLGFGNYAPSPQATLAVQVNDHPVTLTLHAPAAIGRGDPINVSVDADASPTPGNGYIQIRDVTLGGNGFFLGSIATTGLSPLTIELPGMLPGTYKLQATYASTSHFLSAASQIATMTVFDRPTTTTLTATPDPSKWGQGVNVTVVVSPAPDPNLNVVIKVDGSTAAQPGLNPDGVATATIQPGAPGAHTITAEFGNQANPSPPERWAPSSASEPQTVTTTPVETTPPTGTVSINGGASNATSIPVGLTFNASDASGIASTEISNDGVTWYSFPAHLTSYGWNLCDADYGGVGTDGTKTVYVRWRDVYGNLSNTATDTIFLDFFGPTGTVTIFDGSTYVTSNTVDVAVPATDGGSAVTNVALSNDGTNWTTMAYAASVTWTLAPGQGAKSVHAKWRDANGHWSGVASDAIVLDTVAPTATAPSHSFTSGAFVSSGLTPTKFTWTGSDATSGMARYEAALSTDGGAYSTISASLLTGSLTRNIAASHSYRLRVRPVDKAGLIGAWAYGPTFTVAAYQQNSSRFAYGGAWSRPTSASYWGSYEKYATAAGAKATFTFTGKAIAWIGCVGSSRGSARIYVNGVLVKTVSTHAATTSCRKVLWSATWTTSVSRQIRIVVTGTAGHARVDLDALVTGT
jgi:hypothetical protein